jgi:hypothetical protein
MKYFIVGGLMASLLLGGCQSSPQIQTGEGAEVIQGNLVRVDHARSKLAYVDPNADFSKYTAILLTPLGVGNVEIIQPSSTITRPGNRNWELTDTDKQRLQKDFRTAITQRLSENGDYPIVDTAGDNVLQISTILTRLAPTAPKDDFRSRPTGRNTMITEGAGRLDFEVSFRDSQTGEVLALTKDTRSAGAHLWGVNNSVSNAAEVRRVFSSLALQIRAQLDRVHNLDTKE